MSPEPTSARPAGVVVLACLLLCAACTGHKGPAARSTATPTATGPALSGSLQIYADSSLDPVMNQLASAFVAAHPGVRLLPISFEGTQALATSLEAGATPDVVAVVDPAALGGNVVTGTMHTFASDPLRIVVKANDPAGIQALSDLARPGISVVLPDPSLPLGLKVEQALAAAGVRLAAATTSLSAPTIVQQVGSGTDDAGIVEASDVVTGGTPVTGVAIPASDQFPTTETAAAMGGTPNQSVAAAFVSFLETAPARALLTAAGFVPGSS